MIIMFIAHRDNFVPAIFQDEMFFTSLELPAFLPWFVCDVPQYEEGSDEALFTTTYLIGDLDKLSAFAGANKIEKTFIISPGHMNKTANWSMLRLFSISQATYKDEESESQIFRFELEGGKFIDQDLKGISKHNAKLEFKTILDFT